MLVHPLMSKLFLDTSRAQSVPEWHPPWLCLQLLPYEQCCTGSPITGSERGVSLECTPRSGNAELPGHPRGIHHVPTRWPSRRSCWAPSHRQGRRQEPLFPHILTCTFWGFSSFFYLIRTSPRFNLLGALLIDVWLNTLVYFLAVSIAGLWTDSSYALSISHF